MSTSGWSRCGYARAAVIHDSAGGSSVTHLPRLGSANSCPVQAQAAPWPAPLAGPEHAWRGGDGLPSYDVPELEQKPFDLNRWGFPDAGEM